MKKLNNVEKKGCNVNLLECLIIFGFLIFLLLFWFITSWPINASGSIYLIHDSMTFLKTHINLFIILIILFIIFIFRLIIILHRVRILVPIIIIILILFLLKLYVF